MVGQCCYRVCLWQPRREDATVQDELSFVSDGEAALPVLSLTPVWHLRWSLLFHYGIGKHFGCSPLFFLTLCVPTANELW